MNAHKQRRIDAAIAFVVIVMFVVTVLVAMPDRKPHRRPRCPAGQTEVEYADGSMRCLP